MIHFPWGLMIAALIMVCAMMFCLWFIGLLRSNAGWVDFGWVLGLILLVLYYAAVAQGDICRRFLILTLVMLWGLRLGGMLLKRLLHEQEDNRYRKIRASFKNSANLKFFFFFQFQAILDVVLSIPFLIICNNPLSSLSAVEYFGLGVWMTGFVGEAMADHQLQQFKGDPLNKGKVCDSGLWFYSRHPNYFFEWIMWLGYWVIAMGSPLGWLGFISPALMLFFLLKVSGVPLAEEQSLQSRGDAFRVYQKTTSVFIPLPKFKI